MAPGSVGTNAIREGWTKAMKELVDLQVTVIHPTRGRFTTRPGFAGALIQSSTQGI